MSNQAITRPPTKAADSSKTIELAGKNPIKPVNLGNATVLGILVTPEQAAQFNVVPLSQQPTTINVQQNITINNFNGPPQEPPKHGNHEGSQGRLDQGRQKDARASRTIENRPPGVNTSSLKLTTASTACPKSHDGAVGRSSSSSCSRCAQGQTCPTQNVHKLETDSARTKSPAEGLAAPRPPQQEHRKFAPSNVTAASAKGSPQGKVHKKKPQPEKKENTGLFNKIFGSHSDRGNTSEEKANLPPSTAPQPVRGSSTSHSNGTRENSIIRRSQGHGGAQAPPHQNQAPSELSRASAPGRQMQGHSHDHSPSKRHDGATGTPHGQSDVDQRPRVVPEAAVSLSKDDILKREQTQQNNLIIEETMLKLYDTGLDKLNDSLKKFKNPHPARVILIGKASAEVMELDDREEAYHIDLIHLDGGDELRSCMKHDSTFNAFREFDKPTEPPRSPHSAAPPYRSFFGTNKQARATALRAIVENDSLSKCILKKAHLQVYLMRRPRALRFELARMAHPEIDEKMRQASGNLVVRLLWHEIQKRAEAGGARTYLEWSSSLKMEDNSPVPGAGAFVGKVVRLFRERYGERGTVYLGK